MLDGLESELMSIRKRVFNYITFGDQLLVLDHVNQPDLAMQIPGGTIEADESPAVAAIREAEEETGLSGFELKSFLGDFEKDLSCLGRAEIIHAYFFHLELTARPALRWQHAELNAHDQADPIMFELYWVDMIPKPKLGGIDDAMYDELLESVRSNAS